MNKKDVTLLIPDEIMTSRFSNYAIAVYCSLQALNIFNLTNKHCITPQQIIYNLTEDVNLIKERNRICDYIHCGLNELIESGIIKEIDTVKKHYILDCSRLWVDTKSINYTVITFSEVKKIFTVDTANKFSLLRYFITLMGTLSSKITVYLPNGEYKSRVIGNFTIDYLSDLSGMSKRTIIDYNKILEEINLIYIYRQSDFTLTAENDIKRLVNVYGRYSDIDYINAFAFDQKKYQNAYKYIKGNNDLANNKRRLAQMYQQLLRGKGEKYSERQIIEIYNYVVSENKKYQRLFEKNADEDYLDKCRDIDVFEKYNFIKTEEEEN